MEKKKYYAPEVEDLEIESLVLLAGSGEGFPDPMDGTLDPWGEDLGGDSDGEDY